MKQQGTSLGRYSIVPAGADSAHSDVRALRKKSGINELRTPSGFTPSAAPAAVGMGWGSTVFAPGDAIGAYRMAAVIAPGRTGMLVRARSIRLGSWVALKVLPDVNVLSKVQRLDSALARALLAAPVNHPNLVRVIDVSRHGAVDLIASELIEGLPLSRFLGVSIAMRQALAWLRDIAAGAARAHEGGIAACGLKSSSIFITPSGAKVSPFAGMHTSYNDGRDQLDAAGDQFGWGILASELLVGAHPLASDIRTSAHFEALPDEVQALMLTALAPKPADRHASMAVIRDALQAILDCTPEVAGETQPVPAPISVPTPISVPVPSSAPPARAHTIVPPAPLPPTREELVAKLAEVLRRDIVDANFATFRSAHAKIVLLQGAKPGSQRYSIELIVEIGAARHHVTAGATAHAIIATLVKQNAQPGARPWTQLMVPVRAS